MFAIVWIKDVTKISVSYVILSFSTANSVNSPSNVSATSSIYSALLQLLDSFKGESFVKA